MKSLVQFKAVLNISFLLIKQEVKTILDRRAKKFKIDIKYLSEKSNFKLNSRHQVSNARLAYQVLNFLKAKIF